VDARIAEGTLKQNSFFDTINTGDAVIYPQFLDEKTAQEAGNSDGNFPFIYSRIRQLR
jgi:hypothetical protein